MIKDDKHIEIVRSSTKGLSSMSQESAAGILSVLEKHYAVVKISIVNTLADLQSVVARKPDLIFLGMEFIPKNPHLGLRDTNRIWISTYLDEHGIAYTGSSQTAHELGRNKPVAKQRMIDAGLKTASFCVIKQDRPKFSDVTLDYPLFIKPTDRGGGLGVDSLSVARNFDQLVRKVNSIATNLQADSLVEEYLSGREFSVAILKDEQSDEFLVMPIELIAPPNEDGARMLSGHVKSANVEQAIEITDTDIKAGVSDLALQVFYALGARDFGRIDIRFDLFGVPHFLEANLIPSLISGYGSFPKACLLNINLDYEPMIMMITRLGLGRAADDSLEPEAAITLTDQDFTRLEVAL